MPSALRNALVGRSWVRIENLLSNMSRISRSHVTRWRRQPSRGLHAAHACRLCITLRANGCHQSPHALSVACCTRPLPLPPHTKHQSPRLVQLPRQAFPFTQTVFHSQRDRPLITPTPQIAPITALVCPSPTPPPPTYLCLSPPISSRDIALRPSSLHVYHATNTYVNHLFFFLAPFTCPSARPVPGLAFSTTCTKSASKRAEQRSHQPRLSHHSSPFRGFCFYPPAHKNKL